MRDYLIIIGRYDNVQDTGTHFVALHFANFWDPIFWMKLWIKICRKWGFWAFPRNVDKLFFIFSSFFGIAQYCVISLKSAKNFEICQHLKFQCFQYLKWSNWCEFHGSSPLFRQDIPFFLLHQRTEFLIWPKIIKFLAP